VIRVGTFSRADGLPMPALSDTLKHIDEASTALGPRGQNCGSEYSAIGRANLGLLEGGHPVK